MRARNIKPGFFVNESLALAHPIHQVIFAGLWCMADRRGVLEDRPAQIHMRINPGRALAQTRTSISWLEQHGFIVRYEVSGLKLIKVSEFHKHQNPHRDEKPSALPDYGASTVLEHVNGTVPARGSNGATNGTGTVPIGLIPSSLIPDPLIPDSPSTPLPPSGGGGDVRKTRSDRKAEAEIAWRKLVNSEGELGMDDVRVQHGVKAAGGLSRINLRQSGADDARLHGAFIAAFLGANP